MTSEAMTKASNEMTIKRVELGLRLLTAIAITSTAGLVLLQLTVRFGVLASNFGALTF